MSYLLDTNIVSELRRPRPEPRVLSFIAAATLDDLYLSDVTMAEIRFGIERVSDPLKRAEIASWLDHVLRPMFGRRVLPITEDVILRWRLIVEAGRQRGYTYSGNVILAKPTRIRVNILPIQEPQNQRHPGARLG